jgi:hypothetical protein
LLIPLLVLRVIEAGSIVDTLLYLLGNLKSMGLLKGLGGGEGEGDGGEFA